MCLHTNKVEAFLLLFALCTEGGEDERTSTSSSSSLLVKCV